MSFKYNADNLIQSLAVTPAQFGQPEEVPGAAATVQEAQQILADQEQNDRPSGPIPEVGLHPFTNIEKTQAEQLTSIKRSPTDWAPRTLTALDTVPIQLTKPRVGRKTLMIFNGSAAVTLARTYTDLVSPTSTAFITLNAGNSLSIETEGGFWWKPSAAGMTISYIETFWDDERIAEAKDIERGR